MCTDVFFFDDFKQTKPTMFSLEHADGMGGFEVARTAFLSMYLC